MAETTSAWRTAGRWLRKPVAAAVAVAGLAVLGPTAEASAEHCAAAVAAGVYGPPIWCQRPLVASPASAKSGPGWWDDDFGYTGAYANLPSDYLTFEKGGPSGPPQTAHFYGGSGGHWQTDVDGNGSMFGGTVMRPDATFSFDPNGVFIVDTEVASGLLDYSFPDGGSMAWTELNVTTAPRPTSLNGEGLYTRDFFQGAWTWSLEFFGNTRSASGGAITAQYIDNGSYTPGTEHNYICKDDAFEDCGGHKTGFLGTLDGLYPQCARGADPDNCYVRVRLKLTAHGGRGGTSTVDVYLAKPGTDQFTLYGHDEGFQLNPALTDGHLYVYQGDYQYRSPAPVRFHWDYLDVNPQLMGSVPTSSASSQPVQTAAPRSQAALPKSHAAAGAPLMARPPAWTFGILAAILAGTLGGIVLWRRRRRVGPAGSDRSPR